MIWDVPGSRAQRNIRSWIPDPDTQHCRYSVVSEDAGTESISWLPHILCENQFKLLNLRLIFYNLMLNTGTNLKVLMISFMTFSGNAFMSSHSETQSDGGSSVSGRRSVQLPGTVTDSHSETMSVTVLIRATVRHDSDSHIQPLWDHARYSYMPQGDIAATGTYSHSETIPVQ